MENFKDSVPLALQEKILDVAKAIQDQMVWNGLVNKAEYVSEATINEIEGNYRSGWIPHQDGGFSVDAFIQCDSHNQLAMCAWLVDNLHIEKEIEMIEIKNRFSNATIFACETPELIKHIENNKYNLNGANLDGANLNGANLDGANLDGANLRGANLRGANLIGANLDGANLRGANLRGANLIGANLIGANLDGANLNGANLDGANLIGANLDGANLDGEKLTKTPIQVNNLHWFILVTENYLRIGCKRFTHEEWEEFDNRQIAEMDGRDALKFWAVWKAPLLAMCAAHKGK